MRITGERQFRRWYTQGKDQEDIEMLVLTRKRLESIQIGDDIVVKVLKTGKGTVKIGIEAPRHIRVLRAELCELEVTAGEEQTIEFQEQDEVYSESAVACSDQFPQPYVA